MSNYSKKQQIFAEYLLHQFGIDDMDFTSKFLQYYAYAYGQYVKYDSGTFFNTSEGITQLVLEKDIRKNRFAIKPKNTVKKHINATDLANFTFCPASFCITESFLIEHPTGEKQRLIGEQLHNKLNLIRKVENYKKSKQTEDSIFDNPDILKILNSQPIFIGHDNNTEKKFFVNNETSIVCSPDYIFLDDDNKYFLVEEKYHFYKDPSKQTYNDRWLEWNGYDDYNEISDRTKEWDNSDTVFFRNHQIQVITYLKNIKEYKLDFGFLIYWYYDFDGEEPYIHKVSVKKIILNNRTEEFYNSVITKFKDLTNTKRQDFNNASINPNKCAGCVVNKYCGHKNKKYNELKLPYDLDYLKFFKVDFPEELKKAP